MGLFGKVSDFVMYFCSALADGTPWSLYIHCGSVTVLIVSTSVHTAWSWVLGGCPLLPVHRADCTIGECCWLEMMMTYGKLLTKTFH